MHLTCSDCGADIQAQDINIDQAIAKCRRCNAVLDVAQAVRGHARGTAPNPRPRVPQPSAIIAEELGHGLRLTRRWLGWSVVPLTFLCVAWDSFLIFWYTMALRQGMPWIMVVFPIGHLAIGVGLTYLTLALYVNRTTVAGWIGRSRFATAAHTLLEDGTVGCSVQGKRCFKLQACRPFLPILAPAS